MLARVAFNRNGLPIFHYIYGLFLAQKYYIFACQRFLGGQIKFLEKWIEDSNDQGRIPEPPGTETGSNKAAKKRKGNTK